MTCIHNKGCVEFFQQIKSRFDYLFEKYGFLIVDKRGNGVYCLLVIQSGGCQIRFQYDRGVVEISVGTTQKQYNMFWIVNFVRGKSQPMPDEMLQIMELFWSRKMDDGLCALSKMLKPVCEEVVELFQEETFKKKQRELEEFYRG